MALIRLPRYFFRGALSFRFRFIFLALFISIFFLFLQFYALHSVTKKPPPSPPLLTSSSSPSPKTAQNLKYAILGVVQSFVELMTFLEVPVFVIDPTILQQLLTLNVDGNSRCKFFCQVPDNILTFGVAFNFWPNRAATLQSIISAGFHLVRSESQDPRVSPFSPEWKPSLIPTHLLFEKNGFFLHLVFFYERSSNSFWFDLFQPPKRLSSTLKTKDDNEKYNNDNVGDNDDKEKQSHFPTKIFAKLRLGAETAGSISRIETTRVNLDGIKVFVPKDPVHVLDEIPSSTFLECNHSRAISFFSRSPRDVSAGGEAFRHLARKTILTASKVLDALGIRFWISSGTLLGWYRQCDVITYSGDVDFGIFIHDYDARLIAEFQRAGLELMHLFGKTTDSFELSFAYGDMKLDLFFFYREGEDTVWNGGTQARTGKKFKYLFRRFTLCWAELLAVRVRVPCPTLPYLEANYGERWMEPVKNWDWKKSPPNVRGNGQWPVEEWEQVIQSFQLAD